MRISRSSGLAGARTATGATVVIDVFRAYSAAAYALAAGATEIVLAAEVDEAFEIAATVPDAVLMGEVSGVRPDGFDLGNSPGEIQDRPDAVTGRTIIHRSSGGTRCARAALDAGAGPLYVAGLVVASATAAALSGESSVTIVASGESGITTAVEDEICADVIAELLVGGRTRLASSGAAVAATDRARFLNEAAHIHPQDVRLCSVVDRFDFAMRAETVAGLVRVRKVGAG